MYPDKKYESLPRHQNKKDLAWEDVDSFISFYFGKNCDVKYEFHLYNPRWKNSMIAWQVSCAKKIDAVVTDRYGKIFIIETDPVLIDETLGQLLVYKYWYEKQEQRKVSKMIALCGEVQEQTAEVCQKYGIEVWRKSKISEKYEKVSILHSAI